MNEALTENCFNRVIGGPTFTPHRLLMWDNFKCHVSKDTKDSLQKLKIDQAVMLGGCPGFIQAPSIVKAWDSISSNIIVNSFKVCGWTNLKTKK